MIYIIQLKSCNNKKRYTDSKFIYGLDSSLFMIFDLFGKCHTVLDYD